MYYIKQKNNSLGIVLILILLLVIIYFLINLGQKLEATNLYKSEKTELTITPQSSVEYSIYDLVNNASYSMVGISKLNNKNTSVFLENSEEKLGIGSGIVLTSNGYILSNYETTGDIGETCYITHKTGTIFPGCVKWVDKNLDISIVKISTENMLSFEMGDSNEIKIGDKFYLINNATGYDFNVNCNELLITKGKCTLKFFEDNATFYAEGIVKQNIEINYETNGGAVLNSKGKLLGITSKKVNAIIPINKIKTILEKIKENENYKAFSFGINGFDYSSLKYLVPDYPLEYGIYVDNVSENSVLSGNVFQGDIIMKIDSKELCSFDDLNEYILKNDTKEEVMLKLLRGTKEIDLAIRR